MSRYTLFLFQLFVFLNCIFQVFGEGGISYDLPEGWFRAGDKPQNYLMGVDFTTFYDKPPSGFVKATPEADDNGFGTLMQNFIPKDFLGERLRLSCFIKHDNVQGWAGLWMRVDSEKGAIDNMSNRQIKGTGDWKKYECVLDVPNDTLNLAFGILLSGQGEVWLDECKFETVDPNQVKTTEVGSNPKPKRYDYPINLSF